MKLFGKILNSYIFSYEDPRGNVISIFQKDDRLIITLNNQELDIDRNSVKVMLVNIQSFLWK